MWIILIVASSVLREISFTKSSAWLERGEIQASSQSLYSGKVTSSECWPLLLRA